MRPGYSLLRHLKRPFRLPRQGGRINPIVPPEAKELESRLGPPHQMNAAARDLVPHTSHPPPFRVEGLNVTFPCPWFLREECDRPAVWGKHGLPAVAR